MAHLVTHDGLNLFRRTALQQIVIQRDAHGVSEAAYVGAHARGLLGGVDLINIFGIDTVGARQAAELAA